MVLGLVQNMLKRSLLESEIKDKICQSKKRNVFTGIEVPCYGSKYQHFYLRKALGIGFISLLKFCTTKNFFKNFYLTKQAQLCSHGRTQEEQEGAFGLY